MLISFALEMGAGPMEIGLLSAASLIAHAAQVPSIEWVERWRQRKKIVIGTLAGARVLILLLALLPYMEDRALGLPLLVLAQFVITSLGSSAGCALNSWLHDLVPRDALGDFFSRRLLAGTVCSSIGTLAAGWLIDNPPYGNAAHAYAISFAVAGLAGFASLIHVARCPEPAMPPATGERALPALRAAVEDPSFRPLLSLVGAWTVASQIAAPFISVFLLQQLGHGAGTVTALWVTSQVANAMTLQLWGRVSDRLSNKAILSLALPAHFAAVGALVFVGSGVQAFDLALLFALHGVLGVAGGGIGLATGNLGLKLAPPGRITACLAAVGLVSAALGAATPTLAGMLAQFFEAREASLAFRWTGPEGGGVVSVVELTHWDFLFVLSAAAGLYVLHVLSRLSEGTEFSDRHVVRALGAEASLAVTHASSTLGNALGLLLPFAQRRPGHRAFAFARRRDTAPP